MSVRDIALSPRYVTDNNLRRVVLRAEYKAVHNELDGFTRWQLERFIVHDQYTDKANTLVYGKGDYFPLSQSDGKVGIAYQKAFQTWLLRTAHLSASFPLDVTAPSIITPNAYLVARLEEEDPLRQRMKHPS